MALVRPDLVGFTLFLLAYPMMLVAQDGDELEPSPVSVIMVASQAQEEGSLLVIRALEAHLSDLPVVFHVTWVGGHGGGLRGQRERAVREAARLGAVAVFWCPNFPAEEVYLLLSGSRGESLLVRTLESSGAYAETLALIVRGAVNVLVEEPDAEAIFLESSAWASLDQGPENSSLDQVVAPEPSAQDTWNHDIDPEPTSESTTIPHDDLTPINISTERRLPRLSLAASYELALLSRDELLIQGVSLGVGVRVFRGLTVSLSYTIAVPSSLQEQDVELKLLRFPILLGLVYRHHFSRIALGGGVVLGLTPIVEEVSVEPSMEIVNDGSELELSLQPTFEIDIRLVGSLYFQIAIRLAVPIQQIEYLVQIDDRTFTILSPWAVRPTFVLGLRGGVI